MISQEAYSYMLNKMSSTEMDVCLYLSVNHDWDNQVHFDVRRLAAQLKTTPKYLREIISTFTSHKKGTRVLVPTFSPGTYKFNLAVSTLDYNEKTVKYCKNFNFFYTDEFRSLSLNAKRLVLLSAYDMSTKGTPVVSFFEKSLVRRAVGEGLFPMKRKALHRTLEEINNKLSAYVQVTLKQSLYADQPEVEFAYKPEVLQDFQHNYTERAQLKRKMYYAGIRDERLFTDDYCIAIEKVAMHLFKSLVNEEREIAQVKSKDADRAEQVRFVARKIYNLSIEKFAASYNNIKEDLKSPDQVSAYLSAIVHQVMLEEMVKIESQYQSYVSLYEFHASRIVKGYNHEENKPFEQKVRVYQHMGMILSLVAENWIVARVNKVIEDVNEVSKDTANKAEIMQRRNWTSLKDAKQHIKSLYEKEMIMFEEIKATIKCLVSPHIRNKIQTVVGDYYERVHSLFRPYKEQLGFN